jgi:hypothetical protein
VIAITITMWPALVFGWPAVIAALVVFGLALVLNARALAVIACLISAPFCLFVSGYPVIRGLGLLVLGTNVAGAIALWRHQRVGAALLWTPFVMLAGLLAVFVARTQY